MRRLTDLSEDTPVPVWSSDGKWIAFTAEFGLYLLDADGKQVRRLAEDFTTGGVAWLDR